MTEIKRRKLNLRIIPAVAPSMVGVFVALLVLGNHIGIVLISLVAGYLSYFLTTTLIEFIWQLKRNKH